MKCLLAALEQAQPLPGASTDDRLVLGSPAGVMLKEAPRLSVLSSRKLKSLSRVPARLGRRFYPLPVTPPDLERTFSSILILTPALDNRAGSRACTIPR